MASIASAGSSQAFLDTGGSLYCLRLDPLLPSPAFPTSLLNSSGPAWCPFPTAVPVHRPRGSPRHPEGGGPKRSSCGRRGWHALLWQGGTKGRRGALDRGWGPSVLWSRSSRGCCAPGPARALLGVPSSSVLKPYLGEQKAGRHIRSRDRPDHHAGASSAPIRQPAWPPGLWSGPGQLLHGRFLQTNPLSLGDEGVPARPQAAPNPPLSPPTFGPLPP